MKKPIKIASYIAVCLLLAVVCLCLFGCQTDFEANKRRHVNSINHRGHVDAPENTLVAFRLSKEKGFDLVECDVCFTKDNHPVLLHDSTVTRTSNGTGKISEMTLDEVRKLDFGSWKSERYAGERIPTFQEFVDLCVELELHPYVHVKCGATTEQTLMLLEIVAERAIPATWLSFDREILSFVAQFSNDRVGLLTEFVTVDNLSYLEELSDMADVFIDCNYLLLTQADVDMCKQYAIPLEIWTVNSEQTIANIDPYITGVTSDCVNAQKVFNNPHLHTK